MPTQPWSKFFWRDWLSDMGLRACTFAARGLWMDMLCIMAHSPTKGYLLAPDGSPIKSASQLNRLINSNGEDLDKHLVNLKDNQVFSVTEDGIIFCRRMVKDSELSAKRFQSGIKGGNPSLVNQMDKQKVNQTVASGYMVSASVSGGDCQGEVVADNRDTATAARWFKMLHDVFKRHTPQMVELQKTRGHLAELIAAGTPEEKFAMLCDWLAHSRNQFKPKNMAAASDPANWTKWQQLMEDEIERVRIKRNHASRVR